jgi:hypothetical protein
MSRGSQRSTRQLTDQQLAEQNQLISQSNQQGTQDRSLLLPTIQSLLTSPGYTPAEQSAIAQQSMGAANTAFDALRERAANRAAATNDTAPLPNSPRSSAANRRKRSQVKRSRIKSRSPISAQRINSLASTPSAKPTASTRISSATQWASRRNCSACGSARQVARRRAA